MSHHVYTTDAYVLESSPSGEADRTYSLLTRDLGVLRAVAKGVRHQRSKLKASLQEYSRSRISLVRGKDIWRVTNAAAAGSVYGSLRESKKALRATASIFALVRRLSGTDQPEEAARLFEVVDEVLVCFAENELAEDVVANAELVAVMKVMRALGYLPEVPELEPFCAMPVTPEFAAALSPHRRAALRAVNGALRQTQL